jgi:queuine tRNA-ribosyltransferase
MVIMFSHPETILLDGVTHLPTFMPVATQAAIKGVTPQQVEGLGITLILNNTYHLNLRPGIRVLREAGGAHKLQGWNHNLLTVRDVLFRKNCFSFGR